MVYDVRSPDSKEKKNIYCNSLYFRYFMTLFEKTFEKKVSDVLQFLKKSVPLHSLSGRDAP